MQKEIENFEFLQAVIFKFVDSLGNNGAKYLIIFEYSAEEVAIQTFLMFMPVLKDITERVLSIFGTKFFIK